MSIPQPPAPRDQAGPLGQPVRQEKQARDTGYKFKCYRGDYRIDARIDENGREWLQVTRMGSL